MPPEGEDEARGPESVDGFWGSTEDEGGGPTTYPATGPLPDGELDKAGVVEALLFVSPVPLSVGRIAEITEYEPGAVREIVNRLSEDYRERGGGLLIREVAGGFGFYATAGAAPFIARLIKSQVNPRLTRAALETLAIVAYLQPVSRGTVAEIRGVQSEGVMKTLEDRGLVREVGKGGPPGYPALYGTTGHFLDRFGINSIEELPDLDEFAADEATVERIRRSLSQAPLGEVEVERARGRREGPEDTVEGGDSIAQGLGEADSRGPGHIEREDGDAG